MRIVMIAENDPAGTAILFTRAINRLTRHSCRLITCQTRYEHDFPKDIHVPDCADDPDGLGAMEQVLREADVFHFHMLADEHYPLGPFKTKDFFRGQAIIHHHHGHPVFRSEPTRFRDKYQSLGRDRLLVSTPDLLRILPEAAWLPNLVPLDHPLYLPRQTASQPPLHLCHSPTRKDLKNTKELLVVADTLAGQVSLDLIDNVPHAQCLQRKQQSHAVFDHMQGYYGVSSLEGMSQGKAVIAGVDDFNETRIKEFFGCTSIPWIRARDEEELEQRLLELAQDPGLCEQKGRDSRTFMKRYWTEERVLESLLALYEQ